MRDLEGFGILIERQTTSRKYRGPPLDAPTPEIDAAWYEMGLRAPGTRLTEGDVKALNKTAPPGHYFIDALRYPPPDSSRLHTQDPRAAMWEEVGNALTFRPGAA
ncbi:hypothetical protein PG994_002506 [Apiospora phragmitis]|uniref:Uncharacterized protein n=1 Tax=Apiospora phragmitis TaxID=2905665 RepID=A0ABR1W5D8_9PEZI